MEAHDDAVPMAVQHGAQHAALDDQFCLNVDVFQPARYVCKLSRVLCRCRDAAACAALRLTRAVPA